jgi:type IV secretion system protein VirB11
LATVHAEDAQGALHRLDRLAQRNNMGPQAELVGAAVDMVVLIAGGSRGRKVKKVVEVEGWDGRRYKLREVAA